MATTEAVDVVMPQMGVSVSEGTITKWLKQEGEQIEADEALLEISTDKVDTEVPSPATGIVTQILVPEGETVEVGTKLAVIGGEGGASAEAPPAAEPEAPAAPEEVAQPAESPAVEQRRGRSGSGPAAGSRAAPQPAAAPAPADGQQNGKSFVSPVVARIAAEHGVDVSSVPGTGRGGRVTKKDILNFVESGGQAAAPAPAAPPHRSAAPAPAAPEPAPAPAPAAEAPPKAPPPAPAPRARGGAAGEQLEPMNAMRRGIAEHMRRSLDTSAHVTSAIEVDMSPRRRDPRQAQARVPEDLRREPDVPDLRRPRGRRDAEELPLDQRRDPRRADRHAAVGQPRLRGRARPTARA